MHKKAFADAQFKLLSDEGPGTLGMYLSTFHNWDRVRPIPEKPVRGAFEKHLAAFIKDGFIAEYHDWGKRPIATVTNAREDDYGLWVEAEFHTTHDAQEARITAKERLARGKSVKSSMGYEVLDDEIVDMDDEELKAQGIKQGRLLKDIPLYEGSIVNVPANPLASVTGAKSLLQESMPLEAHLEIAQAANAGVIMRLQKLVEMRNMEGKAGAVIRRELREQVKQVRDSLPALAAMLDEILAASEPKADPAEVRKALAYYLVQRAGLLQGANNNG
jgi:HK97 family phage prohead protease